jgi:hypothetical protein
MIDSTLPFKKKGMNYFKEKSNTVMNNYINLILECLACWREYFIIPEIDSDNTDIFFSLYKHLEKILIFPSQRELIFSTLPIDSEELLKMLEKKEIPRNQVPVYFSFFQDIERSFGSNEEFTLFNIEHPLQLSQRSTPYFMKFFNKLLDWMQTSSSKDSEETQTSSLHHK